LVKFTTRSNARASVPRLSARRRRLVAAAVLATAILLGSAAGALASGLQLVSIPGPGGSVPFKSPGGFGPTFVTSPPGDTHRVFVGTQDGYIYVIDDGVLQPTPFLDLHSQVSTYNEDGLWSMAFDPGYATNRRFYVAFSDNSNSSNLNLENYHFDEFQTSAANPDLADPSTQTQILEVPTTGCTSMTSPHYGGQLAFGPDGDLWLTIGDGGDGCNDDMLALSLDSLHGKLLRIVPQPTQAANAEGCRCDIPAGNPLVGKSGVDPEIWAYGLRNPYRFSFDPTNGNVIIADVGNSTQEEVDDVPSTLAAGAPPPFFGWPCFEGTYVTPTISPCPVTQTPVAPVITFVHGTDPSTNQPYCTAIIGGYVLEDPSLGGDYDGRYVYGYFCADRIPGYSGEILTTNLDANPPVTRDEGLNVGFGLSSFGEDACGHVYAMNVISGGLWRIEGSTPGPCGEFRPPHTTLTGSLSGIVKSSSATFTFSSNIAGSTFACTLDGAPAQPCSSPASYTGLPDGPHTFSVAASDQADNKDPTPPTATWISDTGPPVTTIRAVSLAKRTPPSATITFTASESDVTFTCALDGGSPTPCSSPVAYEHLAVGAHLLVVIATDAAGNIATPAIVNWVVPQLTPIHLVFASGYQQLLIDAHGDLRVALHPIADKATGTLSLRRAGKTLASRKFQVAKRKPIKLVLFVSSAARRSLRRADGNGARLVVSLIAKDGQVAHASATTQVLEAGSLRRYDTLDAFPEPLLRTGLLPAS
jgi:glucose/arabinose dehydrogenase